jgi:uncharacterized protein YutD
MQTITFNASINNGIVHIPKKLKNIPNNILAQFTMTYITDNTSNNQTKLQQLFNASDNKINTNNAIINTDEMINDIS